MVSLRPKEGGGVLPPNPPRQAMWIPVALGIAGLAILGVGYMQHSSSQAFEERIATLEHQSKQLQENLKQAQGTAVDLASDLAVVTKRMGVTNQDLAESRRFAEKLRQDQERAREQLASEIATKASTTDVAAAREEAST